MENFEHVASSSSDLSTQVEIVGDRAIYEVRTANPLYQDRLLHIGFVESGRDRYLRRLSVWGEVTEIHARFADHLEEILLQSARLRPVRWEDTLELFLKRVQGTSLRWFLYGSAALAIRGIDVQPGDLDFWVEDTEAAGFLFEDLLIEPVTTRTGWVARYGGRAFAECLFEWLAEVDPKLEKEPHEQGAYALERLESVGWRGWTIPVPPLALQRSVAERRGLKERVAKIEFYLSKRSEN